MIQLKKGLCSKFRQGERCRRDDWSSYFIVRRKTNVRCPGTRRWQTVWHMRKRVLLPRGRKSQGLLRMLLLRRFQRVFCLRNGRRIRKSCLLFLFYHFSNWWSFCSSKYRWWRHAKFKWPASYIPVRSRIRRLRRSRGSKNSWRPASSPPARLITATGSSCPTTGGSLTWLAPGSLEPSATSVWLWNMENFPIANINCKS